MEKNSAFQYATSDGSIMEDTGLITLDEANELFESHKEKFIKDHEDGKEPEMCIWTNMKSECDYHTDIRHVDYSSVIEQGIIYNLVEA